MAPARGAEAQGAGQADGLPRDHQGRDPARRWTTRGSSTLASSTRRRPGASWTGSTAEVVAGALAQGRRRASRPAACSPPRPAWSSTASASASPSSPPATGTSTRLGASRMPLRFAARLARVDGAPLGTGTRLRRPRRAAQGRRSCSTSPRRAHWRRRSRPAATASVSNLESKPCTRSPARAVHHLDPAAGGGAQALYRARKHAMSVAQRLYEKATSPICAPTRRRCQQQAIAGGPRAGRRAVRRRRPFR